MLALVDSYAKARPENNGCSAWTGYELKTPIRVVSMRMAERIHLFLVGADDADESNAVAMPEGGRVAISLLPAVGPETLAKVQSIR